MKFNFRTLTHSPERLNVQTAKLGDPEADPYVAFTDDDIGKPVKKGTQGNYLLCEEGDAIEGFIDNVDAGGTADGMTLGGVAFCDRGTRKKVVVDSGGDSVSVLSYVEAGGNSGAGIANSDGLGVVQVASGATKWRIVSLEGDVAATTESVCTMEPNPSFDDQQPADPDTNPEEIEVCVYPSRVVAIIEMV